MRRNQLEMHLVLQLWAILWIISRHPDIPGKDACVRGPHGILFAVTQQRSSIGCAGNGIISIAGSGLPGRRSTARDRTPPQGTIVVNYLRPVNSRGTAGIRESGGVNKPGDRVNAIASSGLARRWSAMDRVAASVNSIVIVIILMTNRHASFDFRRHVGHNRYNFFTLGLERLSVRVRLIVGERR